MRALKEIGRQLVSWLLSRKSMEKLNIRLCHLGLMGLGVSAYDPSQIDERRFLRRLNGRLQTHPVVLDVGANQGQYARLVREEIPGARIISFEPNKISFETLQITAQEIGIEAVNAACGSTSGRLVLYDEEAKHGSQLASFLPGALSVHGKTALPVGQVPVITLDEYMRENGIAYVDLLKIDVEGFELEVIKGASHAFANKMIGCVQFEYNRINSVIRCLVADFEILMPEYRVSRLLKSGEVIDLSTTSPLLRDVFWYQNLIASPRTAPPL